MQTELRSILYGAPMDDLTYTNKLRAAELLARILGLTDKEQRPSLTVNQLFIDTQQMSEAQLLERLAAARRAQLDSSAPARTGVIDAEAAHDSAAESGTPPLGGAAPTTEGSGQ